MPSVNHGGYPVFNQAGKLRRSVLDVFRAQFVLAVAIVVAGHRVRAPANPSYPAALPTLFPGLPSLAQLVLLQSLELDLQLLALIKHCL